MATTANATSDTKLVWRSTSPWENPHPNDMYTLEIEIYNCEDYIESVSFTVSGMRLILCKVLSYTSMPGDVEFTYYNMGEFTEPICSSLSQLEESICRIKRYADYIIEGLKENGDLRHCPSFEILDDVDENLNPI